MSACNSSIDTKVVEKAAMCLVLMNWVEKAVQPDSVSLYPVFRYYFASIKIALPYSILKLSLQNIKKKGIIIIDMALSVQLSLRDN